MLPTKEGATSRPRIGLRRRRYPILSFVLLTSVLFHGGRDYFGGTALAFTTTTSASWARPLVERVIQSKEEQSTPGAKRRGAMNKMLRDEQQHHQQTVDEATFPKKNRAGIYQIMDDQQHRAFLEANKGKLIVMKFYAPYCQACKALDPKFKAIATAQRYENLPLVWAEMGARGSITQNFFQALGIIALPTILLYDGANMLVENFPCAPKKLPIFQKKLTQFLTDHIDPETLQLKDATQMRDPEWNESTAPRVEREILIDNELVTEEHLTYLRTGLPFFRDLSEEEFFEMLSKAKLQTFDPGDIIIRQGMPGNTFYVIKSGQAEMYVRSKFDNLLSTPSNYLGAVVNELGKFDYFGERALTSGQPLAASVRCLDKTRCFAFDVNDIPESSILSKERRATEDMIQQLSRRYALPDGYGDMTLNPQANEVVLDLLVRFKQIRQATKGFEYILRTEPQFDNRVESIRRSMLVAKLSKAQRDEFREVFNMADVNHRGKISLLELRQFMSSAGRRVSDTELMRIIYKANPRFLDGASARYITLDDFLGVMAEAEFYYLFRETFQELDKSNSGYVRAGDLEEVLGGVRNLITEDDPSSWSIIDGNDKDILIDYDQFSMMLLGAGY